MHFPPYLFGFPMTTALWYVLVVVLVLVVMWILQKVFKTIIKDFAGGMMIFVFIIIFAFVVVNIITGSGRMGAGFNNFFDSIFN